MLASLNQAYFAGADALWALAWVAWAPMGYLILVRRPGNGVGAGLMVIGVTMGASLLLGTVAAISSLPMSFRVWAELASLVLGFALWIGIVWLLIVFPSGYYSSPGQRLLGMFLMGFGALAAGAFAVGPNGSLVGLLHRCRTLRRWWEAGLGWWRTPCSPKRWECG